MVPCLIQYLIILISTAVLCSSNHPCLTWEINQERLKFICRIIGFSHPVSLLDSLGQVYVYCRFTGNNHDCTPFERNDMVVVDFSRNIIVFTTRKLDKTMNGVWICLQDNLRLTTQVSLSKGIIDSTKISITGSLKDQHHHVLMCFSCREPDSLNVEILINGRTEDSITYNPDTSKCTHQKGECSPYECYCTGNTFMRVFQFDIKSKGALYTCDMLFTDPYTNAKFSMLASVVFNEKGFFFKSTSISIVKAADKIWNETFTSDGETGHVTELEPTRITPVTETSDDNAVGDTGGFLIPFVTAILMCSLMGGILACVLVYLHHKRDAVGPTNEISGIVPTDSIPFLNYSTPLDRGTQPYIQENYV